ncbi:hypothetical protein QR685DRAFT_599117 [Neurospora intermedia]|uniref:Uncharacterized protein n=1 Tax=Neurospora intermedia TaxID=5142 RepID=A0ABR3D720_NEUIN
MERSKTNSEIKSVHFEDCQPAASDQSSGNSNTALAPITTEYRRPPSDLEVATKFINIEKIALELTSNFTTTPTDDQIMYKARVTVDRALTLHPTRQDGSEIMMAIKSLHGHFYSMWNVGEREDVKLLLRVKLLACMMAVMRDLLFSRFVGLAYQPRGCRGVTFEFPVTPQVSTNSNSQQLHKGHLLIPAFHDSLPFMAFWTLTHSQITSSRTISAYDLPDMPRLLTSKPDEVSYPRKASGRGISRSTMPASASNTRGRLVSAPRHTLLPMAFRIIPINRITREMTQSSTVIPTRPKIALRARQVIQKALLNGTHDETIEMALTKLLSNFNYLWSWGGYKDKSVGVTVGLLNEMLAVLKGGHALYVIAYTLGFPDVGFPVGRILHLHFPATGLGLHYMYSAFVWYAPELTALSIGHARQRGQDHEETLQLFEKQTDLKRGW